MIMLRIEMDRERGDAGQGAIPVLSASRPIQPTLA